MKRARRLSSTNFSLCSVRQRLVRWTSLCVCFALVLSALAIVPFASVTGKSRSGRNETPTRRGSERVDLAQGQGNGQVRRVNPVPPQKGPPAATLPNLDEVKRRHDPAPKTPAAMSSSVRSKRKPLASRGGKRVGDPGTTGSRIGYRTGSDSDRESAKDAKFLRKASLCENLSDLCV